MTAGCPSIPPAPFPSLGLGNTWRCHLGLSEGRDRSMATAAPGAVAAMQPWAWASPRGALGGSVPAGRGATRLGGLNAGGLGDAAFGSQPKGKQPRCFLNRSDFASATLAALRSHFLPPELTLMTFSFFPGELLQLLWPPRTGPTSFTSPTSPTLHH